MSNKLQIRGKRGAFNDYEAFIKKFEAAKTTDDCYTPQPIYDAVLNYVFRNANLPEDTEVIRPFYPGGDYTREEYPEGSVVVDNPPFSILTRIVAFYVARGIRFFLFAPSLTLFSSSSSSSCTKIVCGTGITYANKAKVATSFLTNLWGDNAIIVDGDLTKELEEIDPQNNKPATSVRKIIYPDCVVSSALLQKLAKRGISVTFKAEDIRPIKKIGLSTIFGGGVSVIEQGYRRESCRRESCRRESCRRESSRRESSRRESSRRESSRREGKINPYRVAHNRRARWQGEAIL